MATLEEKAHGKVRVFVYGTLKEGQCNNSVLRNSGAELYGYDTITGNFVLHDMGGLPALMDADLAIGDQQTIYGQVWFGDTEMLAACDMLEGHPDFYMRRKLWSDRYKQRVWVYFMPHTWDKHAMDVLTDGIWKASDKEVNYWKHVK